MNDAAAAQLTEALRDRLALIADENSRRNADTHMQRLGEISARIQELTAKLPPSTDPRLKHFLERCSYSKALELLAGRVQSRP